MAGPEQAARAGCLYCGNTTSTVVPDQGLEGVGQVCTRIGARLTNICTVPNRCLSGPYPSPPHLPSLNPSLHLSCKVCRQHVHRQRGLDCPLLK